MAPAVAVPGGLGLKGPRVMTQSKAHYEMGYDDIHDGPADLEDVVHAIRESGSNSTRTWGLRVLGVYCEARPEIGYMLMQDLLMCLGDESSEVQKSAIQVFAQLGDVAADQAVELVVFLDHQDPEVRAAAAEALGQMQAWNLLDELKPCFSDPVAAVVLAALKAVTRWGDDGQRSASSVLKCLGHKNREVRAQAVRTLEGFSEICQRTAGQVVLLLEDNDNATRQAAVSFFATHGPICAKRAASHASKLLSSQHNGRVQAAAAVALGHMKVTEQAVDVSGLLTAAYVDDKSLALSAAGLEQRVPVELRRPDCAAAYSLALMGEEGWQFANNIVEIIADSTMPPEAAASLVRSLGLMGEEAYALKHKLEDYLESPSAPLRQAACYALGEIGREHTGCEVPVAGKLQDPHACVRTEAAKAMGKLKDGGLHVDEVAALFQDTAPEVQAAAVRSVAAMGSVAQPYTPTICCLATCPEGGSSTSTQARVAALEALGGMGDRGAAYAEEVASQLQAMEPEVRAAALRALSHFDTEAKVFMDAIDRARSDPVQAVRIAADDCAMALGAM
eukprot:TRINITY_DN31984_c0_g1_i1.p1 TRINITY_DN31984_c0_g1~~TRINITY_DN31984_c0_g1_i1.p1  ORF type:complete len:584 (+),score=123.34 TRINITY_DN31984_c0_g1_i1:67-1752(+)